MTEHHPRAATCPTCTRRLLPVAPGNRDIDICRYVCARCGTVGWLRVKDGRTVWDGSGDDSAESRQARAMYRQDGYAQMKSAGAKRLPGLDV